MYAEKKARQRKKIDEELVLALVRQERKRQPRLGTRKLLSQIGRTLGEVGITLGRDRLFELLGRHNMLVEPKEKRPRTTNSRHSLPVFQNLIKDLEVTRPNQVWVSDITYLRLRGEFVYASIVTDLFSRKIVGWHVGDNLEAVGCCKALEMAFRSLPEGVELIHHSDRGSQYCSHMYVEKLRERGCRISMTQELHCYENAVAERINGILKSEYELDAEFETKGEAQTAFEEAQYLYNHCRPHTSLGYRKPAEVYAAAG